MSQSHTSGHVTWADDEALRERNVELLDNSGELSANQSADDLAYLLSGGPNGSATDRAATECPKQHGMWCRVKAFSLPRSGRERGVELEDQDKLDSEGVSRLTRLKRIRKGHVRQDELTGLFMKAERELRKQASHLELQIQSLNEINEGLQEDAKIREANIDELQRKLYSAERRLASSQRKSAKLNGILELAKLQGNAQQQVLDVKQDDVIKMAVKQAELYDQIRKLKLTIETLRNKLEKCEAEKSGSNYQPQDERAEHPSSMPLPTSTTRTMHRMQAAVDARRAAGRHTNHSNMEPDETSNHLVINDPETRRSLRRHHNLALSANPATAYANRRIKHQRAINTALRANVKNKDKRIQELIDEKHRTNQVLEKLRQMAKIKIEVIYKNLLSLPGALTVATSPSNVGETIATYLKEVDSSASVEEVRKILSRLKEFGKFLRSDESFDGFMKKRETQHTDTHSSTHQTATQMGRSGVQHLENSAPRRILRRQKVNKSIFETRRRAARRMLDRTEPVERKDCRTLPKGGKHCRCCCYDAKMKKLASLREVHTVAEAMPFASAERDVVSESTQETLTIQGNTTEMIENACQVLPDDTVSKATMVENMVRHGLRQHLEVSEKMGQEDCLEDKEQTPSDRAKDVNDSDGSLKGTSPVSAEVNSQSGHGGPGVRDNALGLTENCVNTTLDQSAEDALENRKDIIKKVSDLLVDKWCLEGQVKALVDNERELTVAKSEISCQLDTAHRQLARSSSDTGRLHASHNILALEEKLCHLQRQLEKMEEQRDEHEAVKSQLQSELDDCKKKVDDLETVKKRLEGEVEGWMETVMEVRRGRITLLNHMDNITDKVGKLNLNRSSCKYDADHLATLDHAGKHSSVKDTCGCSDHEVMRVNELKADIETLAEQRKIQDSQIEQLSDLLQRANDQKQQLMNHVAEVQQERNSLQFDFDQLLAHE